MALVIFLGYAIGSVPFALLLARRWGAPDLRTIGSGNLGAANVFRASGVTAGILVAALDITKGALSVTIARYVSDQAAAPAAAGLAAIIGHIYPLWLRFRGGKGVATACGVFAVLTPLRDGAGPDSLCVDRLGDEVHLARIGARDAGVAARLRTSPAARARRWRRRLRRRALIVFRHRSNLTRAAAGPGTTARRASAAREL